MKNSLVLLVCLSLWLASCGTGLATEQAPAEQAAPTATLAGATQAAILPTPTPVPPPPTPIPPGTPSAPAPPTPTPVETAALLLDTPTPTVPPPDTPAPMATPTPSSQAVATQPPVSATATRAVAAAPGQFVLLKPGLTGGPSFGPTDFEWQWNDSLGANQGFEVRVWREGEAPAGVHNSVEDNQNGKVVALGNNTYRLNVDIRYAAGVGGRSGEYWWTVALVQISPDYQDLGQQASPARLHFEAGDEGGTPTF